MSALENCMWHKSPGAQRIAAPKTLSRKRHRETHHANKVCKPVSSSTHRLVVNASHCKLEGNPKMPALEHLLRVVLVIIRLAGLLVQVGSCDPGSIYTYPLKVRNTRGSIFSS